MGAGFLQDLSNQGATQNAQQFTMPTYQGGGYTTTQGQNFNYTTPDAPYAGMYTAPININPPRAKETTPTPPAANPFQMQPSGQVYYDPAKGQYYTQNINPMSSFGSMQGVGDRNYIGSSPRGSSGAEGSFENPSPLPNYSMYIAPEQMPNINAYLNNPNSLLSAMQDAGVPSAGAGRFSNLLSTNTTGK